MTLPEWEKDSKYTGGLLRIEKALEKRSEGKR